MELFKYIANKVGGTEAKQEEFEDIQLAQIELIQRSGNVDTPYVWIEVNSAPFRRLIDDSKFNYVERLGNKNTRAAAIEEIEGKLTPLNTIH